MIKGNYMKSLWISLLIQGIFLNIVLIGSPISTIYEKKKNTIFLKAKEKAVLKSGADIAFMDMKNNSEASVSGKIQIAHFTLFGDSKATISGEVDISHLYLRDRSKLFINNATIGFLSLYNSSEVTIKKIDIQGLFYITSLRLEGGTISLMEDSKINIYAKFVTFENGKLTGFWKDGSKFSFWLIKILPLKPRSGDEYDFFTSMPSQVNILKPN